MIAVIGASTSDGCDGDDRTVLCTILRLYTCVCSNAFGYRILFEKIKKKNCSKKKKKIGATPTVNTAHHNENGNENSVYLLLKP